MIFYQKEMSTPLGPMLATADEERLIRLDYGSLSEKGELHKNHIHSFIDKSPELIEKETKLLQETERQLKEYFNRERYLFSLPYKFYGTSFQKNIWEALAMEVPYGETITYKGLAESAGNRKAVRAVGGAMNKNPFSIVVPCHRVVGQNGKMTGYGGGVDKKVYLLNLENTRS
ncbi:methylated-DNA--[protein]-cysteine S-methyltransferase [Salimicrobium humidisoli]|nr:methylated-DNA--[protein]-cysteine S-methyltransferase [Salimicrobium humidisoli]